MKTILVSAIITLSTISSMASVIFTDLSQSSLTVGDQIRLRVMLKVPPKAQITPPDPQRDFGSVIIKEWNSSTTPLRLVDSLCYQYIITSYTAENCTIPALTFVLLDKGRTDTLRTLMQPLRMISVLPASDSVTIRDVKPWMRAGRFPLWWIWLIVVAAAIVAGFYSIRRFIRPRELVEPPPPPPRPPYDEAMDALAALESRGYLHQGLLREFVFDLSDIFKRYIGRRFENNIADSTTEEILAWASASALKPEERKIVDRVFSDTDPVKFAKWIPNREQAEVWLSQVRSFLTMTRPQPQGSIEQKPGGVHAA